MSSWFSKKENEDVTALEKVKKDPKALQELLNSKNDDQKKYEEHVKAMKRVQESKKMRLDMRPGVMARTMTKEIFLLAIGVGAPLCMALFYLKIQRKVAIRNEVMTQELIDDPFRKKQMKEELESQQEEKKKMNQKIREAEEELRREVMRGKNRGF